MTGRPHKLKVDYFPHFANHGKTIFILENKYGNNGYAFWFKLLELLCQQDGLYYSVQDTTSQEFLSARSRLDWDTVNNILNTLAELEAIDKKLWQDKGIIWIDKLVGNLSQVFIRRTETPVKPGYCKQKPTLPLTETHIRKERKVKESKEEKSTASSSFGQDDSPVLSLLNKLTNWKFQLKEDCNWLNEFLADYSFFTILDFKKCRDYHSDRKKANSKGTWKTRFRNWAEKEKKIREENGEAPSSDSKYAKQKFRHLVRK